MLAMALSGGDYLAIAGLLAAFLGLPGMILIGLVRGLSKSLDAAITRVHERIDQVDQKVAALDGAKIDRKDFLREVIGSRQKLDRVSEQIAGINGRLDAEFGVGAAINNLAGHVGKLLESKIG